MEDRRVLLTGASGFVGRAVVPLLVEASYEVHAIHRSRAAPAVPGVRAHRIDLIEDEGALQAVVAAVAPTHLLHLAWYTKPGSYWSSEANVDWLAASLRLIRAFAAAAGRRAVLVGTCAEYDPNGGVCVEEATPLRPTTLYGACKNALRAVAESHARTAGYSSAWARLFYAYGPGEPPERLVPSVVRGILAGDAVDLSHGRQRRDFLFVEDVAAALVRLLESDLEGAINIGSGHAISVRDMVGAIADRLGGAADVRFGARGTGVVDPPLVVADTGRLRDELEWTPAIALPEGIDRTAAWWRGRLTA
jgi:nucleoside-diphosphate-sugar epimerase